VSVGGLNLSRRPFVNGRPVTRVALLLWLLGGLLLLVNVFVYISYVSGTGEKRAQLARVEQQKEKEQRMIRMTDDRFASLNLAAQNEQVDFLNEKIAERTFGWSQLFDRMSRLLPADVRLTRLSPHGVVDPQADRRRRGAPVPKKKNPDGRVTLAINGESKSDTALLKFVDNLFADAAFADPNLLQQTKDEGKGVIRFDLRVDYLPRGTTRAVMIEPAGPGSSSPRARRRTAGPEADPDVKPEVKEVQPLASGRAPVHPRGGVPSVPGAGVPGVGVPPPLGAPGAEGGPGR
jgi:Tfp pilus assembly protein PilN